VRERLQARGVVRHDILGPWEVGDTVMVAVHALVVTGDLAEVGSGADGGDCPFPGARHRWCVVAEVFQGGISN
jgi:hypothetical protein